MARLKTSAHTVTGDAREVWHLIVNAKAAGIDIASVSVGSCKVELRGGAAVPRADSDSPRGPRGGIYDTFGGDRLARLRSPGASGPDVSTVAGEDYQPALGVDG